MTDHNKLREEFEKIEKSDCLTMIKFYESNIETINLLNPKQDENQYNFKMRLQSEYGLSLLNAGHFTKSVSIINDSITMFENSTTIEKKQLHKIAYFEHLLWNYGVALWETKNIPEATKIFKKLVKTYPMNEKYKAWLNGLKVEKIRRTSKLLWVFCAIWIVGEFSFFNKLNQNFQLILSLLGLLILITIAVTELYIYNLNKKPISIKE